jgi:hypothetical protein
MTMREAAKDRSVGNRFALYALILPTHPLTFHLSSRRSIALKITPLDVLTSVALADECSAAQSREE